MNREIIILVEMDKHNSEDRIKKLDMLDSQILQSGRSVKLLFDFNHINFSNLLVSNINEFFKKHENRIDAVAACGIDSGVRKIILDSTGYDFFYAENRSDALEWLEDWDEAGL